MRVVVWSYCATVLTSGAFVACGGPTNQDFFSARPEDGGARSTSTAGGTPSRVVIGSSPGTTLAGMGGSMIVSGGGTAGATAQSGGNTAGGYGGESSSAGAGNAGSTTSAGRGGAWSSSGGRASAAGSAGGGGLSGADGSEAVGGTASADAGDAGVIQTGGSVGQGVGGVMGGVMGGAPGTCEETREECDGADNNCDGAIDESNSCPANCSGFSLEANHGYMYCSQGLTHAQAMQLCERQGMRLVTIQSAAENASVLGAILRIANGAPPSSVHIGATNMPESTWSWVDGSVFWASGSPVNGAYVNWDTGEPNDSRPDGGEDCGSMIVSAQASDVGLWNDVNCSYEFAFVCETE